MNDRWKKRGKPIPGVQVHGHGLMYPTVREASAAMFLWKAQTAGEYKIERCETCKGWHIERI